MIGLEDFLRDQLIREAEQAAPLEACGLLSRPKAASAGSGPQITLWPVRNAAEEPETSFLLDPREQLATLEKIWARREELFGVFHSHPRTAPDPSDRDRAIAAFIQSKRPRRSEPLWWVIVGKERCPSCNGSRLEAMVDGRSPCFVCEGSAQVPALWSGQLP